MFPFLYSELQADFCPAGFFVKVAPVPCSVNANPSLRPKPTQAHSELCLAWSALVSQGCRHSVRRPSLQSREGLISRMLITE